MPETGFRFDYLSTRTGCNMAIRHIEILHDVIKDFESQYNLADKLNDLIKDETISQNQILPILNSLLVDKYAYSYVSYNLERNIEDFDKITGMLKLWDAFDLVIVYFHPELGVIPINPKRRSHWEATRWLQKHELLTFFVGEFAETGTKGELYEDCIKKLIDIMAGNGKIDVPSSFRIGKYPFIEQVEHVKPEPVKKKSTPSTPSTPSVPSAPSTPSTPKKARKKGSQPSYQELDHAQEEHEVAANASSVKRMSKMYGIQVTNELFHNGNVEAWKRIIRSYEYKYPNNQVVVYYDNERINDINTLFVWGKVKRGRVILISVVGTEIKDLAKLRRYLEEGASINFSRFIQGNPNMILRLF